MAGVCVVLVGGVAEVFYGVVSVFVVGDAVIEGAGDVAEESFECVVVCALGISHESSEEVGSEDEIGACGPCDESEGGDGVCVFKLVFEDVDVNDVLCRWWCWRFAGIFGFCVVVCSEELADALNHGCGCGVCFIVAGEEEDVDEFLFVAEVGGESFAGDGVEVVDFEGVVGG